MPPIIALLLCIVVVLVLLWIDWKRTGGLVSKSVWFPTLWMMHGASRAISSWFTGQIIEGGYSVEEGSSLDRMVLSLLIIIGFAVLYRRRIDLAKIFRDNRWLFALFLFMLISILWSDFPFVSFKRWMKNVGTVIMALIILTESIPLEALQTVFRRTCYILIPFSAMLVKYFPRFGVAFGSWSGKPMWVGVSYTKNTLGALCMVCIIFLAWTLVRRREGKEVDYARYQTPAELLLLGLSLWLMKGPGGSSSATSVLTLILGLSTFFVFRRLKNGARHLGVVTFLALIGAGLAYWAKDVLNISAIDLIVSMLGRETTFTGRTNMIWNVLVPLSMEHPFLGVGYGAFWIRPIFEFAINEAHNGYLDVFIELGAVGLMLLMILIISIFKKVKAEFEYDRDWASLRFSYLLVILVHNIMETSFLRSPMLLWNIFVLLAIVHPSWDVQKKYSALAPIESDTSHLPK